MNNQKKLMILATMLAFLIMLPVARASEEDQATKLTFNKAVQIPGRVLPAGTYWFIFADKVGDPNVVHIFNSDQSMLYATVLTINAERSDPTDNTAITFADRGSMQPQTMVTWFYPGFTSGHEFVRVQHLSTGGRRRRRGPRRGRIRGCDRHHERVEPV